MANTGLPAPDEDRDVTSPSGGWTPSRGFWIGMAAVVIFAAVLVAAGTMAAAREPDAVSAPLASLTPFPTVQVTHGPRFVTPSADLTSNIDTSTNSASPSGTAVTGLLSGPVTAPSNGVLPAGSGAASSVTASPTPIASSWSEGPVFVPPAPAPPLATSAAALAASAGAQFGINIVTEGQDWGAGESEQMANIGAVISAMEQLPLRVTSSVATTPNGTLTVLSNRQGRTQDGWQPYGDTTISFYANEDHGPSGDRAANQVILATGSDAETVAHELLHAYQFRDNGPGEYALALLGDEMRSFNAATGWQQTASDGDLLAAQHDQWETINQLYSYDGRTVSFDAPNPLEAFAMAGARLYAGGGLDASPEYAAWFAANLG